VLACSRMDKGWVLSCWVLRHACNCSAMSTSNRRCMRVPSVSIPRPNMPAETEPCNGQHSKYKAQHASRSRTLQPNSTLTACRWPAVLASIKGDVPSVSYT
jgi:hypothetical protein